MPTSHALTPDQPNKNSWLFHWLILFWILMLILGSLIVGMPSSLQTTQQVSFNRSFFTAANVSTLTGFPVTFAKPGDFKNVVQIVFLLQTLSGLLLTLVGGGLLLNKVLNHRHSEVRIFTCGLLLIIFAGVMGIATNDPSDSILHGLMRGACALGGSALQVGSTLSFNSGLLHLVFIPLSILGSFGTIVLCDLYDFFYSRKPLGTHSLNTLTVMAVLYVVVCIVFMNIFQSVPRAGALAASSLGYGYSEELISQLPRSIYWIILGLMLTSIGTAGTGGFGIAWLWTMPQNYLKLVALGVVLLLAFSLLGLISLSYTSTQLNTEQALMLTFGSLSNTGIPFSPINLSNGGLSIIGLLMIIGRVLPLILLNEIVSTRDTIDRQTVA